MLAGLSEGKATALPTAAIADEMLSRADQLGYGHRDIAALHEVLAHLSPTGGPKVET